MKGYIQSFIDSQTSEFSESGEPIAETINWGNSVLCKYSANTLNNKGVYQDGKFTQSEFIITTKDLTFKATKIRLCNQNGDLVCVKEVQRLEVLETIRRVQIFV